MKIFFFTIHIFLFFLINISAQEKTGNTLNEEKAKEEIINDSPKKENPFSFEAAYTEDFFGNMMGGIKTGTLYLGMANIKVSLDTKKAGLWNNGQIYINGASTHGRSPSKNLIGDFQIASNIDAGDHIFLQEFLYKHTFKNLEITLGLQDLNVEFVSLESGHLFLNSSFRKK
jgi:porin